MRQYSDSNMLNMTIKAKDIKGFLKSIDIEWYGECRYAIGYDENDSLIYKNAIVSDSFEYDDYYDSKKNNVTLVLKVENRKSYKSIIKVQLDALMFVIYDSLYSKTLEDCVFMMPSDVSDKWIKYLFEHKRGYHKQLINYYNQKVKDIVDESNRRLETLLQTIKKETDDKIQKYDGIKEIIEKGKKRG